MGASKQPSNSADVTAALDELLIIITGSAEKEEHMLKQISSKLNKSTLGKIVSEAAAPQIEFLSAAANMLTAIAGYLYGEKGLNLNTPASQLLGKIKNNAPILGDKPASEILAEGGKGEKSKGGNSDAAINLLIELKGITSTDLAALAEVLNVLKETFGEDDLVEIEAINDMVEVLDTLAKNLSKIDFSVFNKKFANSVTAFNSVVDALCISNTKLAKNIPAILFIDIFKDEILELPKTLAYFVSGNNGSGGLVMIKNRLDKAKLKPKELNKFFIDVIDLVKTASKLSILAVAASVGTKALPKVIEVLQIVITELSKIDVKVVIKNTKTVKEAAILVTAMRDIFVGLAIIALVALPGLIGLVLLCVASKLLFTAINSIVNAMNSLADAKDISGKLKEIGLMILLVGLVLLFAGLTGAWVLANAGNILGFAAVLAGFIALVLLPFLLWSKFAGPALIQDAQDICLLIVTCALVMMIGAVFMLTGLWKESLLFGAILAAFIAAVLTPFLLWSIFAKQAINIGRDISILIATCALVMMLGAFFMKSGLWKEALGFTGILALFIAAVLLPFIIWSVVAKKSLKIGNQIAILIATCALVMMLGAFFMMTGLWVEALTFVLILDLFIAGAVLPFLIWGKNIQKSMPAIVALTVLVVVSTICMMVGANYIREYGAIDMIIFATILSVTIGILGVMCWGMGKIFKDILKGSLAMAIIVAITFMGALAMKTLAEASKLADMGKLAIITAIMIGIIVAIGGLSVALGFLSANPFTGPFFWAGIAAMAAVAGIALVFSKAMKNIAEAAKLIAEANKEGFSIDGAMAIVSGMVAVGQAVGAAGAMLPLRLITRTSYSCLSMGKMISIIGKAVADISNLTVGTKWNSDGQAVEFRQLSTTDFVNAAVNTKLIISILGKAIAELYTEHPDLFKAPMITEKTGFLGLKTKVRQGKTPFEIVTRACSTMGTMITLIAQGVADFADMKVATAWNADGQATAYRKLTNTDFKAAAENISLIISTIGYAIAQIYTDHKSLFELPPIVETGWFGRKKVRPNNGKTPFEKVTQACSTMGSMITDIANGVRDYASMQIATKWNSEGTPIEYRQLTDGEIKQAISNIHRTILTIFHALMSVYNWDPGFFETKVQWKNGFITACNPVYRVISAGMLASRMVSKMARAVGDFASMQIANKWDKEGNPIGYRPLTNPEIDQAIANIHKTVLTIFHALMSVYNWDPGFFETKIEWKGGFPVATTPVYRVIFASMLAGRAVSSLAQGVGDMAKLQIPVKWNNEGIAIKYRSLTDTDFDNYGINVGKIIFSTLFALKAAYDTNPEAFNTTRGSNGWWSWPEASPVQKVINGARGAGEVVAELAKGVQAVLDLNITDSKGKKIPVNIDDFKFGGKLFTIVYAITTGLINALNWAYVGTPNGVTKHLEWFKNISKDTLLPIIENMAQMAEKILKSFKDKNIINTTYNLWAFTHNLTLSMNKITKMEKLDGVKEKLDDFVNPIIESLSKNAKKIKKYFSNKKVINDTYNLWAFSHNLTLAMNKLTDMKNVKRVKKNLTLYVNPILVLLCTDAKLIIKYFSDKNIISATLRLRIFTKGLVSSLNELKDLNLISMALVNKSLKSQILPITINLTTIARILNKAFSEVNVNKVIYDYAKFIFGLFAPFKKINKTDIKNFKSLFNRRTNRHVSALVKSINSLDNGKADKFIELSRELRDLSESVGDISELVDALNGRINETLTNLADKLEDASNSIKESDKAQEKRQKLIEKNTKKLEKVLDKPMKVELSKAASSSSGGGAKSGGGSSSDSQAVTTPAAGGNGGGSFDTETIESLLRQILTELRK